MTTRILSIAVFIGFGFVFTGYSQTASAPSGQASIVLDRTWEMPVQGGSASRSDLGILLSPFAKASSELSAARGLTIYEGVTYLMPLEEAKKALGITQKVVSKNKVACGGFPKDSLFHYGFEGNFDGHFNQLYLVTDKADQVVAVQLVAEKPQIRDFGVIYLNREKMDWHMYNFVNSRGKASTKLLIEFKQMFQNEGNWTTYHPTRDYTHPKGEVDVLRLESILVDPGKGFTTKEQRALEAVRLYLPKPLMGLILQCSQIGGR